MFAAARQLSSRFKRPSYVTAPPAMPPEHSPAATPVPAAGYLEKTTIESRVSERRRPPDTAAVQWLVAGCYLFGAMVLTGRLWVDPAARVQIGDAHDVTAFAWYMRYAATAVQHGHLPALVTNAMGAPQGVNLMWNTPFLLPGILLAPVTLLAGPQVSLTVVLTLGLAGSASCAGGGPASARRRSAGRCTGSPRRW
jgi:hypothetical protein